MQSQKRKVLHYVVGGKDIFAEWVNSLGDPVARAVIRNRTERLKDGNFGDHRSLGAGLWELRVHYGPGYRVYYGEDGPIVVILLCGGDKGSQRRDIRKAHDFWATYRRLK